MRSLLLGAAYAACLLSAPAFAADSTEVSWSESAAAFPSPFARFFVHLGPAGLLPDEGAKIKAAGTRIFGATIKIAPQVTAALEVGYFLNENFAVALTAGVPPEATIDGTGTITGVGKLGSVVYGPTAVTGQYHFTNFGRIQPYVGVGPAYMIVFNDKDGAVSGLASTPPGALLARLGQT